MGKNYRLLKTIFLLGHLLLMFLAAQLFTGKAKESNKNLETKACIIEHNQTNHK